MIDREEIRSHVGVWGTAESQIRKDHLISHVLAGLEGAKGFVFFGGTALNRTVLQGRRISEDIDLYLDPDEPADVAAILEVIRATTRREFPDLQIHSYGNRGDVATWLIEDADQRVQLQIIGVRSELGRYETTRGSVDLRYSDLPDSALLQVPTPAAFVAMKCHAYEDRKAPRDLFDLRVLAESGLVGPAGVQALQAFRGFGPVKTEYSMERCPTAEAWDSELSHQLRDPGSPIESLRLVRESLSAACGWDEGR